MVQVKEIIIVEGAYDKIRLSSFIDGIIFVTGGFSIMKDENKVNGLVKMVESSGGVILTDSDSAGFRIRNFLKQKLPNIKHAYIPDVPGKEKRKRKPGAEGIMGVEGMTEEIIIKALKDAGCEIEGNQTSNKHKITKCDLYTLGLTGRENSLALRSKLQEKLGLPEKLSANMLCDVLSRITSLEELKLIIDEINC